MSINSLVFHLTGSTTIAFAFAISEERSNLQWNCPTLLGEKSSCLVIQLILSSKISFWFAKRALTKGNVRRNKMLWQQKRTQLPILNIDFPIENKTQTRWTKHSVTGVFCSNLALNSTGEKPSLSVFVEIFVRMHAVLLRRGEPYSQLPFLLYHLSTMYYNSQ